MKNEKIRKLLMTMSVCFSMGFLLSPVTASAEEVQAEGQTENQTVSKQAEESGIEEGVFQLSSDGKEETQAEGQSEEEKETQIEGQSEEEKEAQIEGQAEEEKETQIEDQSEEQKDAQAEDQSEEQKDAQEEGQSEEQKDTQPEGQIEETKEMPSDAQPEEKNTLLKSAKKSEGIEEIINTFPVQEEEPQILGVDKSKADNSHGSRYDHVDVKVNAQYNVKVDGVSHSLDGYLQSDSIVVTVGDTTYDYSKYTVTERTEDKKYEYDIKVRDLSPSSISWVDNGFYMNNVYVKARILFETVPDALKEILPTITINGVSYYYTDFDMKYGGVQECTGGKGMRSEGVSGTPTGLDLYLTKDATDVLITKGKLGIEKQIIDEKGDTIEDDDTVFTFYVNGNDVDYEKVVEVAGGSTTTLTDLPAGSYTITEQEKPGYAIYAIDGEKTQNYSFNYTVVLKEDGDIPVATFINTKLSDKSAVNIKKEAEGLGEDAAYPNPTIRIYALDENGNKSEKPVWENTVTANGDTFYLNIYLDTGSYVIEESGQALDSYQCDSRIYLNNELLPNDRFEVVEGGQNLSLAVMNSYSKESIIAKPDPDPDPEPTPEPETEDPKPETEEETKIVPKTETEVTVTEKPKTEVKTETKKETKTEPILIAKETPAANAAVAKTSLPVAVAKASPKTGDAEQMQLWMAILLLGSGGAAALTYKKKRYQK